MQARESHSAEILSLQADSNGQRLLASELRKRVEAAELESAFTRSGLENRLKSLSKVQDLQLLAQLEFCGLVTTSDAYAELFTRFLTLLALDILRTKSSMCSMH